MLTRDPGSLLMTSELDFYCATFSSFLLYFMTHQEHLILCAAKDTIQT